MGLGSLRRQFADKIGDASVTWTTYHADVHVAALGQLVEAGADVVADIVKIELRLYWPLAAFAKKARCFVAKSGREALRLPPPLPQTDA